MTECEPGTIATATVRGVPNVRVMRTALKFYPWFTAQHVGGAVDHGEKDVTDVRPLVVLDLDHPRLTAKVLRQVGEVLRTLHGTEIEDSRVADEIADQIEAQTKPVKREVYEHLIHTIQRGVVTASCGKVWRPEDDESVTIVGRCPECADDAATRWIA